MSDEHPQQVDESNDNSLYHKNFVYDKQAILGPKMAQTQILQNERGQQVHENFISFFLWKKFIWGNLIFLAFMPFFTVLLGMVKLSQTTVNWTLKQLGDDFFHDYYYILKQS